MFTGIITELGTVSALESLPEQDAARLTLHAPQSLVGLEDGGSIAVNGTCLTATDIRAAAGTVTVDVMGETLRRTTVGTLAPGDRVNLERCVPANGRLDGHVVQGHVDGTGTVARIEVHGDWRQVRIALPAGLGRYVAEKGSIAVDGVSLTVSAVSAPAPGQDWFEVGVIPATLAATTLGTRVVGDRVNLEVDVLAKYAARLHDYDRALETEEVTA
ncbi:MULTISPECIES: riboflavin synthase [Citricoccus]|uniref:riboflavin synthase n=1 Tax=Citricoccus TaxID=169133 RepID=UPI000255DE24|nr:riboflavin synthase [Citricoccus sp. CH26A]